MKGTFKPYASLFTKMRSPSMIDGFIEPVGTMFQSLKSGTSGSIKLADVLPPGVDTLFNNYQNQPWYMALSTAEKALVDNFVQRLQGGLDTTVVNYSLKKKIADPWNLLLGGTFDVGRHWGMRAEVGFIGRRLSRRHPDRPKV